MSIIRRQRKHQTKSNISKDNDMGSDVFKNLTNVQKMVQRGIAKRKPHVWPKELQSLWD